MDLSFHRFEVDSQPIILPADLAVMMVGIAARQAASPTALVNTRLLGMSQTEDWFAPASGCFNAPVAEMLIAWKDR